MLLAILNVMYKKYFIAFSNVFCKTSIQDCLLHQKIISKEHYMQAHVQRARRRGLVLNASIMLLLFLFCLNNLNNLIKF